MQAESSSDTIINPPNSFSSPREWADYYRSQGLCVIPASTKKHPTVAWLKFQHTGSDSATHDTWFPPSSTNYSMGFLTGAASNSGDKNQAIFVVDLDVKESVSGLNTWNEWLEFHNNGLDVETWEAKTGSGGRHLYFSVPLNKCPRNTQAKHKGIDIRGTGGFIMAPPSPHHVSGTSYEWILAPWDTEIAPAPEWLIEIALKLSVPATEITQEAVSAPQGLFGQAAQAPSTGAPPARVSTPSPSIGMDGFGNLIDGREKKMTDVAFAVVVNAYRDSPIKPGNPQALIKEAYQTYLQARPKSRLPLGAGETNEQALDREGRGFTAITQKVARYFEQWNTLVAEKAGVPPPHKETVQATQASSGVASTGSGGMTSQGAGVTPETSQLSEFEAAMLDADSEPFPVTDFKGKAPERQWLWQDWIPEGIVCSLYGDGGVGKSLLAQQISYALAAGGKFLGPRGFTMPKKKVMAVFCEDDEDELWRRHDSIVMASGGFAKQFEDCHVWPRVGYDNLLVSFSKAGTPIMSPFFVKVAERALAHRTEFLVLDTAADLFGGNENIRSEVNFFIKSVCGRIIKSAKTKGWTMTIMVLAHPSQSGKASGSGESGSTAWNNAVRSRLYITRPENGLPEQRTLTRMKANYSASGADENLEMIWSNGILELTGGGAAVFDERGTANLDVLRVEIYELVKKAWDEKTPYASRKHHPRELHTQMNIILGQRGFEKSDIIEAIRRMINNGDIEKGHSGDVRGWKPAFLSR